jgi:hypothetical protein
MERTSSATAPPKSRLMRVFAVRHMVLCGYYATVRAAYFEYVCGFLVNSSGAAHFAFNKKHPRFWLGCETKLVTVRANWMEPFRGVNDGQVPV